MACLLVLGGVSDDGKDDVGVSMVGSAFKALQVPGKDVIVHARKLVAQGRYLVR